MGISLCQYRQAIGLFNRVKMVRSEFKIKLFILPKIVFLGLICILLMIGGVETNPGPNQFVKLKNLKTCHLNIRGGMMSKIIDLQTSLCQVYDIITLSETFLTNNILSEDLKLQGYQEIVRRDRPTHGGGLAVYIKEGLSFKRLVNNESSDIEQIWLQLHTAEGKILMCVTYRPPGYNEYWDLLEYNIEQTKLVNPSIKYYMVIGDLNADFNTRDGTRLNALCANSNLNLLIKEATRITPQSQSVLDQILVNMPNFVKKSYVLPPVGFSDHCAIGVELNFKMSIERAYTRHMWFYKKANFTGFRNKLQCTDWSYCFDTDDVNVANDRWTSVFLDIAKSFIPNKNVLVRPRDSPWYTNQLRIFKRKVHRLFSIMKKNPSQHNYDRYVNLRNEYKQALGDAQTKYESNVSRSLVESRNTKQWWSTIKSMLGRGADDSYPPMRNNDTYVTDSKDKANLFNSFFLNHCKLNTNNAELPRPIYKTDARLSNIVITGSEVLDQIKCLDTGKSSGHDGLSPRMLKEAGHTIVQPLSLLFNMSIKDGKFPKSWKKANVIPIHKKGDKDDINNYRPVSVLPIVSKIFERIIFKHVYNHLHINRLISRHQSGFQPNESTINQLAYMYHEFSEALDKKKDVRIVFCDVSKAFDKVWHLGITFKLKQLGIDDILLNWFCDYLKDRKQRVVIKGQCSDWGDIEAGVPQGSVLGPLLFIVYINDLADVVNCNIKLFADDTCLYVKIDDQSQVDEKTRILNSNLSNLSAWADQWLVTFNPAKTKSMIISNKKIVYPDLVFNDTVLENVTCHKHLGLNLSNNLKWTQHIDEILTKASKMLDVSMKFQHRLDRKSLETIYESFIRPKLEYGCQIWDDCNIQDKQRLENFQLRAARLVTGAKRGTSHELLYNELNWEKLEDRRKNVKILFMHKIVNNMLPEYLCELLPNKVGVNVNIQTRNSGNFKQLAIKSRRFQNSLLPDCIRMWNDLDKSIRDIVDFDLFKKNVLQEYNRMELYNYGDRTENIIHAQLRLNCSNLNHHLFLLHVLDDPRCPCGHDIENVHHFFFQCPLYVHNRHDLFENVQQICNVTLNNLLYGSDDLSLDDNMKMFTHVHKFIKLSKRFNVK